MSAVLYVTDFRENKIWEEKKVEAGDVDVIHQVSVYKNWEGQSFQGFGGAFTEAGAYNWQKLPEEKRNAFLRAYFAEEGLGYTRGRVHINSCDFALGNYACVTDPEDAGLNSFQADRDEQYLIPMIRAAQKTAGQPISLLLSPWSPPAFMKTNGDMNHGGKLKAEYRERWAACMAKYAAYYRARGLTVTHMSIQNEPAAVQTWDSCIYSEKEEGGFAAQYLLPALEKAGCQDVRILAWDHNKESLPFRAEETLSAEGALQAVGGFAVHWYTGDHFDALKLVGQRWKDKELWFSEGCVEYSRFDGMTALEKAEMYGHDILGNLNAGIHGSIDWNLLLDSKGGPNHVGNFCEAPVMLNEEENDICLQTEYYYIGHFSRFIRPGARRIASSVYGSELEVTVFKNADSTIAAVVLNRTEKNLPVSVTEDGGQGYNFVAAAHSIATLLWK